MGKTEHRDLFISRLREFTGEVPAAFSGQKEFFVFSLGGMSEHLIGLKRDALASVCGGLLLKLGKGPISSGDLEEFKDLLEKLVSDGDFRTACAGLAGSRELIGRRLASLSPVSLAEEAKRSEGADPEAERHIKVAYDRLNFAALAAELGAGSSREEVDSVLGKARAEIAEYCCLYNIPLREGGSFTPFTLQCIDAALAASHRLLAEIDRRTLLRDPGGKIVLIVDDDESVLEMLDFLVRREGFRSVRAADGDEALKKARELRPALILLDLMLPKRSGFEILRALQSEDTGDIPVIAMTGRAIDRSTLTMIKQEPNVKEFFEKPVKQQILAARLHALTRGA